MTILYDPTGGNQPPAAALQKCSRCNSSLQEIVLDSGVHYSRIECSSCHQFVRWGRSPKNTLKLQELKTKVGYLSGLKTLTEWEAQFIASVTQRLDESKMLSPRQTEWLIKIYESRGGKHDRSA